jgi:hypothetical protein
MQGVYIIKKREKQTQQSGNKLFERREKIVTISATEKVFSPYNILINFIQVIRLFFFSSCDRLFLKLGSFISINKQTMVMSTVLLLLLLLLLFSVEYRANDTFLQSHIEISDWGKQFQPANSIELLASFSTSSVLSCAESE